MLDNWTFKSILLLALVAGVKLSPQCKEGKSSCAKRCSDSREDVRRSDIINESSSFLLPDTSETKNEVEDTEVNSKSENEEIANLRNEVKRLKMTMANLERKLQTVNPPFISGLEEQITAASSSNDWTRGIEILEKNLPESSLEYKQLQELKKLNSLAWVAAENGYTEIIRVLISNGLPVNKRFESAKNTMLHIAAANGHCHLVSFLIDNGANLEAKDAWGWTAVHHAAVTGQLDVLKLLIKRGADINVKNTSVGFTALHYAAFYGRASVVNYLITNTDCDRSIYSNNGETAQDIAKKEGFNTVVKILSKSAITKLSISSCW